MSKGSCNPTIGWFQVTLAVKRNLWLNQNEAQYRNSLFVRHCLRKKQNLKQQGMMKPLQRLCQCSRGLSWAELPGLHSNMSHVLNRPISYKKRWPKTYLSYSSSFSEHQAKCTPRGNDRDTVDGSEIRLTTWGWYFFPIIYKVLYIPGGCLGFLPSTVSPLPTVSKVSSWRCTWNFRWSPIHHPQLHHTGPPGGATWRFWWDLSLNVEKKQELVWWKFI